MYMTSEEQLQSSHTNTSGFDSRTGIYHSLLQLGDNRNIPTTPYLDTATFVLSQFPQRDQAESKLALIDSVTNKRLTYSQLQRSIYSLAAGLHHGLGVCKGDVVFVLSPNSILYPTICLAIFLVGGVLTTANPLNTESEITKQVLDSGAKLAIADPREVHKLASTKLPVLLTYRPSSGDELSVEELIDNCGPMELPETQSTQSDTAAILYSSGTTGVSKGVILTHANIISVMTLLKWSVDNTSANNDVFLCFIPMFHIYGLAFFGLGLFCCGTTTVLMQRYDFQAMLEAIHTHKVNNIPAVPPVILNLVKYKGGYDLSSLRRVGSGAAPLSKELVDAFRLKFPWVALRPGYGLTESCGAATLFISNEEAKSHPAASGTLLPTFCAKVVDYETGIAMPPYREGELWLNGPAVMKGYLGNEAATAATIDSDGWLRTGDLCYFDKDGCLYIVDRIKELIKHNGLEDEEAGEIPMAYVVREAESQLGEDQVIQFVASQVAPFKKVKKVSFINVIPKSAAGKILRKDLVAQSRRYVKSKL
ncbi:AMP-binding, conserved site-containing protein [Cynara cardunculus var. scolymus]|uniref:AMP-binding, conserved site-containing protein n=1 Tax=Cynara cardunculus var. scolymus TaxID=59895 RepID=A0A118K5U9_CYNCS|nr:AMP-binding, conserved site-containing protein [Cynara cardunculus var. scolymus]